MENFQFLTHCTKSHLKKSIQDTKVLKKRHTPDIWEAPLARSDAPHGVWFGLTLWNSCLPTESPFGTERVLKPVVSLLTDLGSYNLVLYLETIILRGNKTYVRLILLRADDIENDWCKKHCSGQLSVHNNQYLTIDMMNNTFTTLKNGQAGPMTDTWVCLFIARDVDVTGCGWDTVEQYKYCTHCKQVGHSNPECSMTECFSCGGYGHWMDKCPKNQCYHCKGYGHWFRNCPF